MRSELKLQHEVHHGSRSRVWLATRLPSGEAVIVKEHLADPSNAAARARTRHEFRMGAKVDSRHVVHYLALEHDRHGAALVEEAFGDRALAELLGAPLPVEIALRLGAQVARGLDDIHAHHIVHRAIQPSNIVVEERSWTAKIVDFSAASSADVGAATASEGGPPGMSLTYASPEQTGRMNRAVDSRSDLYSLGVVLYQTLAGHPPFETCDPLELVHAHMALVPTPLQEAEARVPCQVARIVARLLAKNPEDRYQSARGVAEDLEECSRQLRATGRVDAFALGATESLERFEISHKLYGRDAEFARLLEALREASAGRKLVVTVAGYSGIGKSSLVNEFAREVVDRGGTFIAGKFDQLHRHAPYSALSQALTQACRELLGLPQAELDRFRANILQQLGANAALMLDLVPDLERIVGPQPPAPPAGPLEGPHRFSLTLARLLSVFARAGAPLVLFLDDLQWGDPATLDALSMLLRLDEPACFLVIGAYRDNEVRAQHPLSIALETLRASAIEVRSIQLTGLGRRDLGALLSDTLHRADAEVDELAQLVLEKTSGNPFFVNEFLDTLHADRHLRYCPRTQRWIWRIEDIRALGITANVVDLMLRNLKRLPATTQEALRMAACLGSRFDLEIIAEAARVSLREMIGRLAPALRERLLVPVVPPAESASMGAYEEAEAMSGRCTYRFLHDRVQVAAYESIPARDRPRMHLALGRCLRGRRGERTRGSWTFDVLEQLNRATELIGPQERLAFAQLNLEAGKRARGTTAYHEGLRYFSAGIAAMRGDSWRDQYELLAALHLGAVECAYLAGQFEEADALSTRLLPRLSTPGEKGELYALRIRIETSRGEYAKALDLAREGLAMLGCPVPSMRSVVPLAALRLRLRVAMIGRKESDLVQLPSAHDPGVVAPRKILNALMAAGLFMGPRLFFWAAHQQILWALEQGVSPETADGCAHYGMLLVSHDRDYARARQYGELALALCRREGAEGMRCRLYMLVGGFLRPHARHHVRSSLPYLERAAQMGLESGDLLYTCYALTTLPMLSSMAGDSIERVLSLIDRAERATTAFRYEELTWVLRAMRQSMLLIQGRTAGPTELSDASIQEAEIADHSRHIPTSSAYFGWKIMALVMAGEIEAAARLILAQDEVVEAGLPAHVILASHAFYVCFALASVLKSAAFDQRKVRRLLTRKLSLLAGWSRSAPVNFRHMDLLARARLALTEERTAEALMLCQEGIREASLNGFTQYVALGSELAGRILMKRANPQVARAHLDVARSTYAKWGGKAKVKRLSREFAPLLGRQLGEEVAPTSIDMLSAVRASQALSSETSPQALLEQLLRVMVQASGAQRASLLVEHDGEVHVEGHLDTEAQVLRVASAGAGIELSLVSESIVRYVLRTGEEVVLGDARRKGAFTRDLHVTRRGSKSLLCMAVRHRDRVSGVLFLENDLATDVFTPHRLEILRLLVAQAAISFENARLFDSTQKLNLALRSSEALLRDFFDGMPVGILVVDVEGRAAFSNRRAAQITGFAFDSTTNIWNMAQRYQAYKSGTGELYPVTTGPLARGLRGETFMADDMEIVRDGRHIPLAAWGTPIRGEDGEVRYAMVAFQDVSSQRQAEADRAQLETQLHQKERLEAIGRLAGGVAHDFNNLLTPMLLYTEMARRALPEGTAVHKQVSEVHQAAERAAELTKQLLAFGRRQMLERKIVNLNDEVERFGSIVRRLLREDIEIVMRLAPDLSPVRADPSEMQRVLMNLALNAADAMPQGGRLTFETDNITCARGDEASGQNQLFGPCVVMRVRDTGHGMEQETLEKVFDPFFTTKPFGHGSGLGLPTVYGIVSQHDGRMDVRSTLGDGTTFEVYLPAAPPADGPREVEGGAHGHALAPDGDGETILVVEDEDAVRQVVQDVLERQGYRVSTASSPAEAISVARQLGGRLDLLVSDIVMPGMNGRQLFAALATENHGLRALFISGYSDDVLQGWPEESGPPLLRKPFTSEALGGKVRELLESAPSPGRPRS